MDNYHGTPSSLSANGRASALEKELQEPTPARSAPLSSEQLRLWLFDRYMPGSTAYNLVSAVRMNLPWGVAILERSLNEVVRRHESLRTTFTSQDGNPVQVIAPALRMEIPVLDLRQIEESQREAQAFRIFSEESQKPFDLERGPLLRALLLRLSDLSYVLMLNIHHIITDGWSMQVLFDELGALCQAFMMGQRSPLPELRAQYTDFVEHERNITRPEISEPHLRYWKTKLQGIPQIIDLPLDRARPRVQSFRGAVYGFSLPWVMSSLRLLCSQENATMFMTLLAAYQTLLFRYTAQPDIVVGSPVANRSRPEFERLIGFFVNNIVLRANFSSNLTFRELLRQVRNTALEAYQHAEVPFEKLVEEIQTSHDPSYHPLFQTVFALQRSAFSSPAQPPASYENRPLPGNGTSKFDLSLFFSENGEDLIGALEYATDLFDVGTMERMARHLTTLLNSFAADPDQRFLDVPLLSAVERKQMLTEWNSTVRQYPPVRGVHELFEAQAELQPLATAIVFDHQAITYGELNRRANQLARFLVRQGARPEVPVGVCMERSIDVVVVLLSILKAGAVYIPFDVSYPPDRIAAMLSDSRVPLLLTYTKAAAILPPHQAVVIPIADLRERIASEDDSNLCPTSSLDHLAYVIYTSGSTGTPNGTMIDGRGLLNVCLWYQKCCKADAESSFLLAIPLSADASVKNILTPLISGGRVVLTSATLYDSPALLRTIAEHDVTSINCTPSLFYPVVQLSARDGYTSLASLKQLLPGGEATYMPKLRNWLLNPQSSCSLINAYGPTECSDVCAYHTAERQEIETSNSMPIGIPVRNGRLYVLDSNFRLQPIGVAGELCYAGDGLARGYLNKSDLTAERFVPNPFSSGGRLYRTGDRARWRADGKLEFLGRMDAQTKVRGFRVELSEIEAALAQHSSIKHCAVMVHEAAPNDKRIAAYLVFHEGAGPGVNEIRAFLRQRLPEHMVPAYFIELDEMPLSANRKVDYHALPAPTLEASLRDNEFVAPRDALEEGFAEIWSTVLKVPRVGVTDNFFAIGGHSLTATQIVSQIRDVFEVELPLAQIFERPTIAGLIELFSSDAEVNKRIRSRAKIIRQLASIPDVEVEAMLTRESLSARAAEEQRN